MGRQILLIDDSAMLRRIAANVLCAQPARYELVAATRANEGFARACGGEAAMILIDERIAGAATGDFCRRLLHEPRTAAIPVVLLTGQHGDLPTLALLPTNVVEVLRKPFAPEQLASVVNAIMPLVRRGTDLGEMRLALRSGADPREPAVFTDQPLPPEPPAKTDVGLPETAGEKSIRAAMQAAVAESGAGVLRICPADGVPTEVLVDGGRLVLVTTCDGEAYSRAEAAMLPAKVSPATLQEAAAEQGRTGVPFLLTLGARGLVSKAVAVELLHRFGQRHFARLWTVSAKSLHIDLERLEALPGFALRLEPLSETVDEWLLGTHRLLGDADLAMAARHLGLVGTPDFKRGSGKILEELPLNHAESEFLRRVNGHHDLPMIARSLGLSPTNAFVLAHRFLSLEVLAYRPAPLPFVVTPRTNVRRVLPLRR